MNKNLQNLKKSLITRRWNAILKKFALLSTNRQCKKAKAIEELRVRHSLNSLLTYFEIPRSTFYHNLLKFNKSDRYVELKQDIIKCFKDCHENCGYRCIRLLAKQNDYPYCAEIMHKMGIQ